MPAHAALFTALSDSVHGCTDTDQRLPDAVDTLAEQFAQAGYATVGFFSGPYLHPAFGLGQGFARYVDCTAYAETLERTPVARWAMDRGVMHAAHRDITGPRVYAAFQQWFQADRRSPFFMFIHLWDPHLDFIPPPPYDIQFDPDYTGDITGEDFFFDPRITSDMPARDLEHLIALYDGEIAWTDYHVGRILDDLRRAGILDQTVVAVTSDHGTEFFEHGYKGHRRTLYDEVIHVPLIIRHPARLGAGVRVGRQTRIVDVAPTLLDLARAPPLTGAMGTSLVPLELDPAASVDRVALSELFSVGRRRRSLRSPPWKFFDDLAKQDRFYVDLLNDPGERRLQRNLAEGLGRELEQRYVAAMEMLEAWRARIAAGTEPSTIPEAVRKQLESLGYIGKTPP